jgi:hypothetical protein
MLALASFDTFEHSSQTLVTSQVVKEHEAGFSAGVDSNLLVCATSSKVLVGLGGLEPPTSPLSGVRSNHLSYRPVVASKPDGGASRDRTDDPLLAKQVLSQLSYGPMMPTGELLCSLEAGRFGCRSLVRTSDRQLAVF